MFFLYFVRNCSANKVDSFVSQVLSLFLPFCVQRTPSNNISSFCFSVIQCSRILQYNYILAYSERFAKLTVLDKLFPKHILCSAVHLRLLSITSDYLRCFFLQLFVFDIVHCNDTCSFCFYLSIYGFFLVNGF